MIRIPFAFFVGSQYYCIILVVEGTCKKYNGYQSMDGNASAFVSDVCPTLNTGAGYGSANPRSMRGTADEL